MPASPSDLLRLSVFGRDPASGALLVEVERTAARWALHERPGPGRLGPLVTTQGTWWAAPWVRLRSLWDVVVAHPAGLPEPVVVAALRRIAERADGPIDPDEVWIEEDGAVRAVGAGASSWAAVARYLLRGEAAHAPAPEDPELVGALERAGVSALAGRAGDDAGWSAAMGRVPAEAADGHPLVGSVLEVGAATGADRGELRRAMARSGVLMLLLGLAAGALLSARPAPPAARVVVPGADRVVVTCERRGAEVALTRCRVEAELPSGPASGALDMAGHRMYECRAREGGLLACGPR